MEKQAAEEKDIFDFGDRRTIRTDLDRVMMVAFGRALDVPA